jgi:hypothetical protein
VIVPTQAGRGDLLAALDRLVDANERLQDDVLGRAHAAEHPLGDREGAEPQFIERF